MEELSKLMLAKKNPENNPTNDFKNNFLCFLNKKII
jgi:hypothetical protein